MDTQPLEKSCNAAPATPVAVVILNWNGSKLLREFLPQVLTTTDSAIARVIVADNGSTDDSLEVLNTDFAGKVEVLAFKQNYGFAEGYNRALKALEGYKYAVLLNSDVATTEGWDKTLLDYMEAHPDVAACQPKIMAYRDKTRFEYAGACGGFLDVHGYPYCRGRIFGCCEKDEGQYDEDTEVFWASGACLMVRRELYLQAGGLDPKFFAHMEEIDLCWRLRLAGYKCAAVPAAMVYHVGGASLDASNPRKTYLNFRNNLLMMYKNLPARQGRSALFIRRLIDTLAWAQFVATGKWKHAGAIVRAHRDFARMRHDYTPEANRNLLSDTDTLPRVNILTAYYLHGKRTFAELKPKKQLIKHS